MKRFTTVALVWMLAMSVGCSTAYKVRPLSFKAPAAYGNAVHVAGADIAAKAFSDPKEAEQAFGFDVRGAGMLPVQVVFDNQGSHPLEIRAQQAFLEDREGNLWPLLDRDTAEQRAVKYAKTKEIFKEGAYSGFLGAAAGSLIGAAIGVVTGENVASSLGKGAAAGGAAGAVIGGAGGATSDRARRAITRDLNNKSLENKPIEPGTLAHGFLFFPGEAKSAKLLRLEVVEKDTGVAHHLIFRFDAAK